MATRRWQWIRTAGVVLAAGLAGWTNAQEYPRYAQQVPARISGPSIQSCASEPCRPPVFQSAWSRMKYRLDNCFAAHHLDPSPLGQAMYQNFTTQVHNGIAARMVLYDFDFDGTQLSPRGQDQLSQMVAYAMRYPYAVIIERDRYRPALAEERRLAVLNELGRRGVPLGADRIVVGAPLTPGLAGVEAWIQYNNLLQQTQNQGIFGGQSSQGGGQGGQGAGGASSSSGVQSGAQPAQIPR